MILTPVGSFYRAKICSERFGGQMIRSPDSRSNGPGACFSKVPKRFRTRKAIVKSPTSRLQRCFIHIFLTGTEVPFKQEVSGVYTSLFVDTDELRMALQARKVSGAFEKRALNPSPSRGHCNCVVFVGKTIDSYSAPLYPAGV